MKTFYAPVCALLVLLLMVCGCDTEQVSGPTIPEEPDSLVVHFGVTNDQDYVPFAAATVPMVSGGSGNYTYDLYQDKELVGHEPIEILRFDQVKVHEISLKIVDIETGESKISTVMVTGLAPMPGLPLEATLYTADFWGYVPFTASVLGIARGGVPPYSYEIIVDGISLYEDDNAPIHISEVGGHDIIFRVTDSENNVAQSDGHILGLEPEPEALMQINFVALPPDVVVGKRAGLITEVYGGKAPFQFEIKVDGNVVSTEPTYLYQMDTLGELMAEVRVTDATGMSSEAAAWITGYEADVYTPEPSVDATATPYSIQLGESITLHADVRNLEEPYTVDWSVSWPLEFIAWGRTITYTPHTQNYHNFECRVWKDGAVVLTTVTGAQVGPPDDPEGPTVDVTVNQYEQQINEVFFFHADVRGGEYDLIQWSYTDLNHPDPIIFGSGEDAQRAFDFGYHDVRADVFYQGAIVAWDTVEVFTLPPDPPEPLTIDAFAATPQAVAPYTTTLDADPTGGVAPYTFEWRRNGSLLGTTESISYSVETVGPQLVEVTVTDAIGQTASQAVSLVGLLGPGDVIISWQVETSLKAGPADKHDSETVETGQESSWNRIWFYIKMDVANGDRQPMVLEIVYADGSRRYWVIPDVLPARPAYLLVDGGEALVEPIIEVHWYYPGGTSAAKCDGWNRVLEIHGSREVPVNHKSAQTIQVDGRSTPPSFIQQ